MILHLKLVVSGKNPKKVAGCPSAPNHPTNQPMGICGSTAQVDLVLDGKIFCTGQSSKAVFETPEYPGRHAEVGKSSRWLGCEFFVGWYCWWIRNPKANHRLDGGKTLVNNGINYRPQLVCWISAINSITRNIHFKQWVVIELWRLIFFNHRKMGCFTKDPFKSGCLGFHLCWYHRFLGRRGA